MELFFGTAADGRVYPDAPFPDGAVDAAVVGPSGLVEALEAQLGLLGPVASAAVRTAAYLAKLRQAGKEALRFWSEAYARDAWSTAGELLIWRDTLVGGGWTGEPIGAPRIDDLAAAEAAGDPLPLGLADRAVRLTASLRARPGLRLRRLTLLDPGTDLPQPWAGLIGALRDEGVEVVSQVLPAPAPEGSDLRRVQDALAGAAIQPLVGDGSFVMLEADTALMAAEAVADWLAAGPAEACDGTVVVAPDGDTALLDRALGTRGLPALGLSSASPWRGALQVLPLAFAIAWRPFNSKALLDLLMLPRPPMPRFAASRLARALTDEPGLDGPKWTAAWADVHERLAAVEGAGLDGPKTKATLERWRAWTAGGQFDRATGMPAAEARQIASRVGAWAMEIDGGEGDPLLLAAASAAGAFSDAVARLDLDPLPALLLERVLEQALADGVQNPEHRPEAGGLRAVRAPGALWGRSQRTIWWSFVGPGERPRLSPWSRSEAQGLAAAGVELDPIALMTARAAASYAAVLQRTGACALLVRPALSRADQTVAHPLAHQLRPILKDAGEGVYVRAERLLREATVSFAGRTMVRQARQTVDPPMSRPVWALPQAALARLEDRRESATSLERLLTCQMAWLAQDVLGLRQGATAQIPGPHQLFGNLAHEIARQLLPPGPPPPQADVRARAAVLFDQLLPRMAAPLQQAQYAGELAAARQLVPAALEALVGLMHDRGLEMVGAELEREGQAGALALKGRLDLLVRQGTRSAVLDLKWTHSDRRYREEVMAGRAVQLAVYRGIADPTGDVGDGGFYLLRQRRVLAPTGSIVTDDPLEAVHGDAQTLQLVVNDWSLWRTLAAQGVVLAAGVEGAAGQRPDGLSFEAPEQPCRYCDLTRLCRVNVESL